MKRIGQGTKEIVELEETISPTVAFSLHEDSGKNEGLVVEPNSGSESWL